MTQKLTPADDAALFEKIELRNSLTDKKLCEQYRIGRRTLWDAIQRERTRRQKATAAA